MTARCNVEYFTNADDAFSWIESLTNLERGSYKPREYRLERMARLLESFGNPQRDIPTVHIAGSKGKGSTACFTEAVLRAQGFTTGLYASPHVSDYRERFLRNGAFFDDRDTIACANEIRRFVDSADGESDPAISTPTTFELLTLLAFLLFRRTRCDWIVLETGLGGRLDATNLCAPDICIITPIEREHTEYLGETLEEIAAEKAGIFKRGVPVVTGPQRDEVMPVLEEHAGRLQCPFRRRSDSITFSTPYTDSTGTHATLFPGDDPLTLSMVGSAQVENAALALCAVEMLLSDTDRSRSLAALAQARLPGRAERITGPGGVAILLDGAHTEESIRRLCDTAQAVLPGRTVLLFGSVLGKPVKPMASHLLRICDDVIISKPGTFKPSDPPAVAAVFEQAGCHPRLLPDAKEALDCALKCAGDDGSILVTGSFFMVCEIRRLIG